MESGPNDPPAGSELEAGFRLAAHTVEPLRNRIAGRGGTVTVEPKAMDVLISLARHAPSVALKDALIQDVWEHAAVSDEVLTNAIWQLRNALGDRASDPRYIETIRGRGYRLIPAVELLPVAPEPATASTLSTIGGQAGTSKGRRVRRVPFGLWPLLGLIALTILTVSVTLQARRNTAESASRSEASRLLDLGMRLIDQAGERKRAQRYLAQAIALDPTSARAHAAYSEAFPLPKAGSPTTAGTRAREAARRAITLDPELAAGHLAWARVRGAFDWRWDEAAAALERARELAPDDGNVLGQVAWLNTLTGRCQTAEEAIDRARERAPISDLTLEKRALKVYFYCQRFDRAIEVAIRLANESRPIAGVDVFHATSHLLLGRPEAARTVLRSASRRAPLGDLVFVWARLGEADRVRDIRDRLASAREPYQAALAHLGLGEVEAAWGALEDAVRLRDPEVTRLAVDPRLATLRSDPRFVRLRARVGL